jgi:SAM-dependent methyltransferase
MTAPACPVCTSPAYEDVLSLVELPVLVNAQVRTEDALDVPRGDIDLVVCCACGHLYNRSYDAKLLDYDAAYENTLHYSKQFQGFARALADRLVADHDLTGADVAELGSGPGHFLSMLCEAGVARGFGWDPSYDPARLGAPEHPSVSISTELFPDDGSVPVRLAFSQHVLEHLHDPVAALSAMRAAVIEHDGVVYSEVPNGQLMLEHCALWDLIYEHLSYFVPSSLALAERRAGLRTARGGSEFGGQFLWSEAVVGVVDPGAAPAPDEVGTALAAARRFGDDARRRIAEARDELASLSAHGPVALWGAGSKGITYLNLVADVANIDAVVDLNPRKAGWGVPGTAATISLPDRLADVQPATVLVSNPIYLGEIADALRDMGVDADVRPLWH